MKSICILTSLYPSILRPTNQVFVQQFAWAMADLGVDVTVICPVAVNIDPYLLKLSYCQTEISSKGSLIKIYFPKFISLGQRNILGFKTARVTTYLYYHVIDKVWRNLKPQPEIVYGHFLTPAGICASWISKKYKVSSFAAYGESSPWSIMNYGSAQIKKELNSLCGIVSVSVANSKRLEDENVFPSNKVRVFPNGIHSKIFYPRNKLEARKKFGFDPNCFLVAFTGSFIERKGVLRLAEAVKGLKDVSVAFAGKGPQQPKVDNCVYCNIVSPEIVPEFLSAADVFVLPTLNEGCCNAIIEAMACGLPIISSNLFFNHELLKNTYSILVDPTNINEIKEAIVYLKDNPAIREDMARNSIAAAKNLTIEERVKSIYSWIKENK